MPPEWNTRSMVEVPELLVSGLLHESDWPTLLGAFSRATLSKIIWLSQGARPWPKFPANGMTWACAAAGRRTHRERRRRAVWWPGSHAYLLHVFGANALRQYAYAPSAAASASPVVMVQLKPQLLPLPPADRPNSQWLYSRQPNFFRFMPDHEAFPFTQRIFHLLLTDFDFQHLAAVSYVKPKYSVVLRRATRPE